MLYFQLVASISLFLFCAGTFLIFLRKAPIWTVIGQSMALKGIIFFITASLHWLNWRIDILSVFLFISLFLLVVFTMVCFSLIIGCDKQREG